jgi:translation initiation factor IF-3
MVFIKKNIAINNQIKSSKVRVIDVNGEQIGVLSIAEALEKAEMNNLDLIQISSQDVPVCKIGDFGKYKFELSKKEKENKKKQTVVSLKEVQFSANIDEHDFKTKTKRIEKFLLKGDKVKIALRYKGREITHPEIGKNLFQRVKNEVESIAVVEQQAKMDGRNLIMTLVPKKTQA